MSQILLTGGGGRLGRELQALIPDIISPTSAEMDITDANQVMKVICDYAPTVVVHAAAYTDVALAEHERRRCWNVNVGGTRNVARAAQRNAAKLIHISTDYVFSGDQGHYSETDPPGPVVNYYSLSKLMAEEAARQAEKLLILRTSFRPREFQYPVAYSDVYTSQDYVDIIAPMLATVIRNVHLIDDEILHVATERKSVYELARRRRADVKEGSRTSANVNLPKDVSLNTERWQTLSELWRNGE